MRVIAALVLAVLMLIVIPRLWQREMVRDVAEVSAQPTFVTGSEPLPTVAVNSEALVDAMHPKIDVDDEKYAQLGAQSKADETLRQVRAAQDQAWEASHPSAH